MIIYNHNNKSSCRCCQLISGSLSLTRYYFWGMKKTKRFASTDSVKWIKEIPTRCQYTVSTLLPQIRTCFALRAGRFSSSFYPPQPWKLFFRDQFIRVFDRRYLGLEARGGGQVFFLERKTDILIMLQINLFRCCRFSGTAPPTWGIVTLSRLISHVLFLVVMVRR